MHLLSTQLPHCMLVQNSNITGNRVGLAGTLLGWGGGVYVADHCTNGVCGQTNTTLVNNQINGNYAHEASGCYSMLLLPAAAHTSMFCAACKKTQYISCGKHLTAYMPATCTWSCPHTTFCILQAGGGIFFDSAAGTSNVIIDSCAVGNNFVDFSLVGNSHNGLGGAHAHLPSRPAVCQSAVHVRTDVDRDACLLCLLCLSPFVMHFRRRHLPQPLQLRAAEPDCQ